MAQPFLKGQPHTGVDLGKTVFVTRTLSLGCEYFRGNPFPEAAAAGSKAACPQDKALWE